MKILTLLVIAGCGGTLMAMALHSCRERTGFPTQADIERAEERNQAGSSMSGIGNH